MSTTTEYDTCDLYFAAFLCAAHVRLVRSYRGEAGRLYWVFDSSKTDIDALAAGWMSGEATVPAYSYAERIRSLKSMAMSSGGTR
jgi:hypothetical protein